MSNEQKESLTKLVDAVNNLSSEKQQAVLAFAQGMSVAVEMQSSDGEDD